MQLRSDILFTSTTSGYPLFSHCGDIVDLIASFFIMSDVDYIKSKLGVYPGFPKEVSWRVSDLLA